MTRFTLTEATPLVPEGLRCRFLLADPAQTDRMRVLVVSFEGEYPEGSLGNGHATYIATSTLTGLKAFDADCVILDFRAMTYRWGNSLLQVFHDVAQFRGEEGEPGAPPFPVLAVTSERSRAGFLSLVTPTGRPAPDWHLEDIDEAIAHGVRRAREWLDFI